MTTEEPLDLLGRIAKRGRDLIVVATLLGMIGGLGWLVTGNVFFQKQLSSAAGVDRLRVDLTKTIDAQTASIVALTAQINQLLADSAARSEEASAERDAVSARLDKLEAAVSFDTDASPAIRFLSSGNRITDGRIGGTVRITYRFVKLRDCGKSRPDDILMDVNGVVAHFDDVSILDDEGRGLATPVDADAVAEITYTARIPSNAGLTPGLAQGWVNVLYDHDKCPALGTVTGPRIPFNILPER